MSIRVAINHKTEYNYDRPVVASPHIVRLRPAPHCRTPIQAYALHIQPDKYFINWQQDPFGNYNARLVFPEKITKLSFEVDLVADMTVINPFDFFVESYAEKFPFEYEASLRKQLVPYLELTESGPLLENWLKTANRSPRNINDFLVELNQRLCGEIGYLIRMEPGVQTCEETLAKKTGSCRDTGWLLVQILRHLGLAARFVSGYLIQLKPDVKSLDGPSGTEIDFTDLHAWAEVFVPGAGWLGLDPTSGLFAGEGHIPLACTPMPTDAAPITGVVGKCESEFRFHMEVSRVHEDPRVTKPFSDEEWDSINLLGKQVDDELVAGDVRLSMGGEPTFVSIDDMDGAEWNTAAMGPTKRRLSGELLRRLREQFSPGGMLYLGMGKWYPGEQLPRWKLACYWRKDGIPIWNDMNLFADERYHHSNTPEDANRFIRRLAENLGINPSYALPGYEDAYYYLWREGTLAVNVDPIDNKLDDPLERERLRKLIERGMGTVTGYALPLKYNPFTPESPWQSTRWNFRRQRMFLIPGDSPMGYRLPLKSLPWADPEAIGPMAEPSRFQDLPPLGDYRPIIQKRGGKLGPAAEAPADSSAPAEAEDPVWLIRTALCVEPRDGIVHVFLPPMSHLEHYLELVGSLEKTAQELHIPILIEGYPPPRDHRVKEFQITPDPGVIEVNIHPASSWDELVNVTTTLYEEARLTRLGTEKFMLDGRHTGTGGGNHVTLGSMTPADSPVLRRPDLLKSLLTFWQHHPSLTFLFSGLFVGPTSQMPRVDEARNDSLYELEIAFQQLPTGQAVYPWVVDRVLRNLLVDLTGNTHRTEFCIDKLYSPDSSSGRLGLVELRSLEMPPHSRMSLVQMLLIRSLIARFWKTPYEAPLVRWGTELHDRFMLPHYVWRDFQDVLADLRDHGYGMQDDWFNSFFEFRFPHYGTVNYDDIQVEMRMAIEPWPVLGEEVNSGGTARYVDSSIERLEVKVSGMTNPRHIVTCNGRRLPLQNTGRNGEYVAGVRYRAWWPPSCLHPSVGVHTPLVVDVIDGWNKKSIGGCTYHVSHPGGRSYETFPVNAYEAEGRRISRFYPYGHTPGTTIVPPEEPTGEFPHTLDLRRQPG